MPNTPRSNYSPQTLIENAPDDIRDIPTCAAWFADVMRWADIEREEDIKTDAWKVLKELDSLCARQKAVDVLLGKLQAYIKIYSIETITPFNPSPTVPSVTTAAHTMSENWPTEGTAASDPVLPT